MEWFKFFANLPDDPRVQAAEDDGDAGWLLVQSFCYVTRAESLADGEGFVPDTQIRRFGCTSRQVAALVRERIYIRDDLRKGYMLDPSIWNEDHNLSDSAERKREADRKRIAAKRAAARARQNGHESRDSRATDDATRSATCRAADATDQRDSRTLDLDQKRSDLPAVALVARLADRYAHVLDDDDLLKIVIDSIHARTSRVIAAAEARRIAADILDASKRKVASPAAYVRHAIEREPDPAARWLAAPAPVQPPLVAIATPPCGECDEETRLTREDKPRRCPNCHPLREAS
jgi:hypothetical protein